MYLVSFRVSEGGSANLRRQCPPIGCSFRTFFRHSILTLRSILVSAVNTSTLVLNFVGGPLCATKGAVVRSKTSNCRFDLRSGDGEDENLPELPKQLIHHILLPRTSLPLLVSLVIYSLILWICVYRPRTTTHFYLFSIAFVSNTLLLTLVHRPHYSTTLPPCPPTKHPFHNRPVVFPSPTKSLQHAQKKIFLLLFHFHPITL